MRNANLNNTIKFIDKKTEYEEKKNNSKLSITKLRNKKNIVIEYEKHKKDKALKEKKEKIKNSKIYKCRKKIATISVCLLCLFVIFFLWNVFIKPGLFTTNVENDFTAQSQNLSNSEASTYSSIMKESVKKTLDINYKIKVKNVHRNGNLIYGEGLFTIPEEGDVYYDIILNNYKPYSLKVNGEEYIKNN